MTVIKLALAAAALGAAAHPTPKVVLVKHADFIRQTIPGAKQYFVRTISIGKQDLATIRKASDFTPDDPDVQFFLGQGESGATVGVALFQHVDTPHGPIEVGLTFGPGGAIAHALVTTATAAQGPPPSGPLPLRDLARTLPRLRSLLVSRRGELLAR